MPILPDDAPFSYGFRSVEGSPVPVQRAPFADEVIAAAFQNENEVVATMMMPDGIFQPVDGYSPFTDEGLKDNPVLNRHGDRFIGVRSPQEARSIISRIERKEANDKILDAAGIWGTVASTVAGITSPTTFIPGGAIYRSVRLGTRVGRTALSVGTAAAGGTAVQEAVLQGSTEARTWGESAAGIGGAGVIGGALGGILGSILGREIGTSMPIKVNADGTTTATISPETHFDVLGGGVIRKAGDPIYDDLFPQLVAAGRSEQEAAVIASTAATRYAARAQRFGSDAMEMYRSEGIEVRAAGDLPEGRTFEQRPTAPTFYSTVLETVANAKQPKASPDQWLGTLRNTAGVKPEEMEWLGLEQWLKGQGKSVSKADVEGYIRANQIEVKEVKKGEPQPITSRAQALEILERHAPHYDRAEWSDSELIQEAEEIRFDPEARAMGADRSLTKFQQFTLPGGENYRELLLTLPRRMSEATRSAMTRANELKRQTADLMAEWKRLADENPPGHPDTLAAYERLKEARQLRNEADEEATSLYADHKSGQYKSSHFDEPNILSHIRFNDRVIDGKRTLFIEEVQSDWHQEGKRKGYQGQDKTDRTVEQIDRDMDELIRRAGDLAAIRRWEQHPDLRARHDALMRERNAASGIQTGVPDAPFKTTWPELAMKRMIRYAAENGYEKIAWTPGEVQAARYDLSKHIKEIEYIPLGKSTRGEELYELGVTDKNGNGVTLPKDRMTLQDIGETVGKEIAEKIAKGEGRKYRGHAGTTLEGLDLKVGGEGMLGFYDDILPATVNKLVKKYGGRVRQEEMRSGPDRLPDDPPDDYVDLATWQAQNPGKSVAAHSLDITPALKDAAIEKGFPLFQRGTDPQGRITLNENKAVIELFAKADQSTFMHEAGHLWLDELARDALHAKAPQQIKDDFAATLKWLGVKSADEITTAHHEKWARAFEQYLASGKAPSSALAQAFEQFKEWLTAIYRSLTDLGEPIPAEIRGVMDRLLATDAEIAAYRSAPGGRASAGAAAVDDLDTRLKQGWGGATLSWLTKFMTPLQHMQNSEVSASRMAVAKLADPGGVRTVANTEAGGFQAMVPGGSVEMRARTMIDAILSRYYTETDEVYAEYWKHATGNEGIYGKLGAAGNAARKAVGGQGGPMSPTEFAQAVGRAVRVDDAASADPFIQKAAAVFKKYKEEARQHAVRAGVLEPIVGKVKFAGGHVPRIFIARAVAAKSDEMEERVFRSMKADQERKAVLKQRAERDANDLTLLESATRRVEGRQETAQRRMADVESRIAEVTMATRRGEKRLYAADARVADLEKEIADLEKTVADAKAAKDYDASDLKAVEKELTALRRDRDRALREAQKGAPDAPAVYERVPDGVLPEGFNASRFVGYITGDRAPPKEPSFIRWLIARGGVRDDGGDVSAIFGGRPPKGLINNVAPDMDRVAQEYADLVGQANFEGPEMLRFIADAERGTNPPGWENTFPPELQQRLMEYRAAQQIADDMRQRGLDPENKNQAIATLVGEDANGLVGKPITLDDLDAMGDIPIDPVEAFRRADADAGAIAKNVSDAERIIKSLRKKINSAEKREARALGGQGEAAVNARASQNRMDYLLDRAEFYAGRDAFLREALEKLNREKGDTRARLEKIIDEWEGDTTRSAKSAIERRAEQEAARQEKMIAGTYEGKGGRLASADAAVDQAVARILKSDRDKIDAELRTQARDVVQNMIATPEGRLPYEWGETATKESRARAAGEGNARLEFERRFPVQDADMLDVLENDVRVVMHAYAHSMIPQAEMARAFDGDVQGASAVRAIKEEYGEKIREAKTEKEKDRLRDAMNTDIRKFHGMRDRILGVYALPDNPESMFHRGATMARQFNYMSKMGSMVLSQISDMGMVVMRHGLGDTIDALGSALNKMSSDPKAKKISKLQSDILDDSAIGVEMVLGSRTLSLNEIMTDYGRASKFERGVRAATAGFSFLNLSRLWDTGAQTVAGIAALRRMMRGVEEWAVKGSTEDAEWLASLNIGQDQARRIWAAASAGDGERVKGVLIPEGRTWAGEAGREAYEMMRVALRQSVDSTIIKVGQDKPLIMSTSTGALIGQFKTFIIAAQQRIVIAGLQQADAKMAQGAITMLGLGMMAVALRDLARDGQLKKRTPGEWFVEGFDYSGLGGWMMEPNNIAEKISGQRFGLRAGQEQASRYASRSRADALLGPSFGFLSDTTRIAGAALKGEMVHGDVQAVRNQIPGQNLIWFRGVMNQMQGGLEDALGIEQPRRRAGQ